MGGPWTHFGYIHTHTTAAHTTAAEPKKRPLPRHVAAGAVAPQQQQQKKKSVAVPIYLPAAVGGRGGAVGVCGGVGVAATTVRQKRGRPLAGREWDRSHTRERAGLATPPPCRGHHSGGRACAPQRISDTVLRGYSLVSHSRSVRNAGSADRTSTRFHCIQLCSCHNELLCNMYFRSQLMTRCQPRWQRRWSRQLWRGPPVAASSKHIHSHPLTMAPTVNRGPFAFARARRGRHVVTPASHTSSSADRVRHFVVFVPLLHLRPPLSPAAAQPRPPNSLPPPLPL